MHGVRPVRCEVEGLYVPNECRREGHLEVRAVQRVSLVCAWRGSFARVRSITRGQLGRDDAVAGFRRIHGDRCGAETELSLERAG